MNFYMALPVILEAEGGYVNHPSDRGKETNLGITSATYAEWRTSEGLAPRPVKELTSEEAGRIYFARFWIPAKCDNLPYPLALLHFDAAVHHGVTGAAKVLQKALGVTPDGIIGPNTLAAIKEAHQGTLMGEWYMQRLRLYRDLCNDRPSQRVFLLGWVARLVKLHTAAGKAA